MKAGVNWITPALNDLVLLTRGYERSGQTTGPHYGWVIGRFKIEGSHEKFLLIAPGTSRKGRSIDLNKEVIVPAGNVVGEDTIFSFRRNLLLIYEFPSENFLQSKLITAQADQVTTVVGPLSGAEILIKSVKNYHNDQLMIYYKSIIDSFDMDSEKLTELSPTKPEEFLE